VSIVHIEELSGDDADKWLPYAKAELRRWDLADSDGLGGNTRTRYLTPAEGVTIRLRQVDEFQYIAISVAGGVYMEFQTSGFPVIEQTLTLDGITFPRGYKAAVIGVTFDGKTAKPVILTGKRQLNTAAASAIKRPQQINLIDEPAAYRSKVPTTPVQKKYPSVLYESWAPNHPHTGVFLRAYNNGGNGSAGHSHRGSLEAFTGRDIGFDVPYMDSQGESAVRAAFIRGDADWPRAAGVQTVTDTTHGTREFAIYVDAFNQFYVFPTSQIQPVDHETQNVDALYVKKQTVPFPGWCYVPTERFSDYFAANSGGEDATGLLSRPELDWKFHPDGTKACAVVYARQETNYDDAYYGVASPFQGPNHALASVGAFNTYRDNNAGLAARFSGYYASDLLPQRYLLAPGLIELTMTIALTGAAPQDFTFDVAVREVRNPITSTLCPMLAGYVWYDIADAATRGDLVVMDVERYFDARDTYALTAGSYPTGLGLTVFSVKNLTTAAEISLWLGGGATNGGVVSASTGGHQAQVIDFDLATLSFVMARSLDDGTTRSVPDRDGGAPFDMPYEIQHPSAAIVTFNTLRTVLFPDTIPGDKQAQLTGMAAPITRAFLDGLTFVALNDSGSWSDSTPRDLKNLRDFASQASGIKASIIPAPTSPDDELLTWFNGQGLNTYLTPVTGDLFLVDSTSQPIRFGWFAYADVLMTVMGVTPRSTFFVHPNKSWAFFDQHRIYNPYGVPSIGINGSSDTLTDCLASMELEHVIYDQVHLETSKGSLDTSFVELYNKAAAAHAADDEPFTALTKASLRATLSKQVWTHSPGNEFLQVRAQWYPFNATYYYLEPGFVGGSGSESLTDPGGLVDLTFGALWFTSLGMSGDYVKPTERETPITFSSVVMIT
jgi:hypothetical protein